MFEMILFYLLLLDAIGANIVAWTGVGEHIFRKHPLFVRYFPIARGWTAYYLFLVLWIGYALARLGVISVPNI